MRILFDVPAFVMGGMERQIVDLAGGLVDRGHEVTLVVNKSATGAYRDLIESSGAAFTVLGRMDRFDPRVFTDLVGIVRRFAPDVVVAETFNATLWARLAGIVSGTGVVVAEHSSECAISRKEYWANRALGRYTHKVVGCAYAQVPSLIAAGHPQRAVEVVHNGVDTAFFHPDPTGARAFRAEQGISDDAFVIGMFAAHRREKRHDRLVALAEGLLGMGVEFVVCAIGGGPLYEENLKRAAGFIAADRIRFLGPREDMAAAYSACDVTVLLSDSVETFPLSFLESQACETPVVGMRAGGVGETFDPDVSGFLIEQGDVAAMAAVIKDMASGLVATERMGTAGRRFVETHLTLQGMVSGYESVLREAADAAASHRGGSR
jgi:glycosyltransferase involved in cell wall biosynthesis